MRDRHDRYLAVCHFVIDSEGEALHQYPSIGTEVHCAHPRIGFQEVQYRAEFVVKLGAQSWQLPVVVIRDLLYFFLGCGVKCDSHSLRFAGGLLVLIPGQTFSRLLEYFVGGD